MSFKPLTIKSVILTKCIGLLSEIQMFVTKLHCALLNQCSRLTTLPSQPLTPELGGNHWPRAHHHVLEGGECSNLGLGSSMLCRAGRRASPSFFSFCPLTVISVLGIWYRGKISYSGQIQLSNGAKSILHSFTFGLVECR